MNVPLRSLWLLSLLGLATCVRPNEESSNSQSGFQPAQGGCFYGGVFQLNETEYIKTLFPHAITDAFSYRTAAQVYEGLYSFDPKTLQVVPRLATSYDLDESGTVYTFQLKEGVVFHDDACFPDGRGREFTAEDVAYCFTQLCTQRRQNQNFALFKGLVVGAKDYYEATAQGKTPAGGVKGIEVLSDHEIRITLTEPNSLFLMHLAGPACFIYPKEAEEMYGEELRVRAVGTGPFAVSSVDEDIAIILRKHSQYHRQDEHGNQLPFLEALSIQFVKDKKTELLEFRQGNFDQIYRLPTDYIIEILADAEQGGNGDFSTYQLQRVPEMVTQFLTFNTRHEVFENLYVRRAFNYAVDREKILNFVLNGEGFAPGEHGITPPVFPDYNIDGIVGYSFNLDSARYYMDMAGYTEGDGFPEVSLLLNAEGERNTQVAVELQKQFKDHLNIEVDIRVFPFAQLMEKGFYGDFSFMRAGWYADYPSPENFLWLFSGKNVPATLDQPSYPNLARWVNPKYDDYYQQALHARNLTEANQAFMQAEQVLMDDAPLLVLWYDEGYRLLQAHVKNYPNNPMQFRDFSDVYFDPALITK